jgi:isocitrate dehydrogenase
VPRLVPGWTQPIVVGRHAFGDQYRATDFRFPGKGKLTIKFVGDDGEVIEHEVFEARAPASPWAMYNLDESIRDFARASFNYGLAAAGRSTCRPRTPSSRPMTAASRTSSRRSSTPSSPKFKAAGITYEHRLIDDMVASALKWSGGYVWACKNYDGDVQSDIVAQGFGSLGLMTSVLMTPGRQDRRGRGRARHRHPPLPRAPEGQGDLDQLDRLDLRLDARPRASRQARRQRRAGRSSPRRSRRSASRRSRAAT